MKNPRDIYQKRIDKYTTLYHKTINVANKISNIRFLVVTLVVLSSIFLYQNTSKTIYWGIITLGILVFMYLVKLHNKLKKTNKFISMLREINISSVERLDGKWKDFNDKGEDFKDENHRFSKDLDIFGQGSLFQWISCANTYMGRVGLANILTNPTVARADIINRQQAIGELAKRRWWRQRFQGEGAIIDGKDRDKQDLIAWGKNIDSFYLKPGVVVVTRSFPVLTVITLIAWYIPRAIPLYIPLLLLIIQFIMLIIGIGKRSHQLNMVYQYKESIKSYRRLLSQFEKTSMQSTYLKELKERLRDAKGNSAISQLERLEILVDSILNRNNFMFFPINILTLWDYQCMVDLEKWKAKSGALIEKWLGVIGQLEVLSSLALIGYDYPDWTIPSITEERSVLNAKAIGHPLLTNRQVCNDIAIQPSSPIVLITGSNMSGKSTLLRTIGINLVLAYSGSVVCAKYMRCSIMDIHTCMRISDNLEMGISSFYGELLRIKEIVEATKNNKQVFFLLDEIFKGTNSHDRHIGAKTLIKQLYKNRAMGLVSTHDLELGELEQETDGSVKNYHFQEYYQDDKICFDYRLRPGISTTRNALYLIKMAGIEL